MRDAEWPQRIIEFSDWSRAESVAVTRLRPLLTAATRDGLLQWSFIRKAPTWRLRYRTPPGGTPPLDQALSILVTDGVIHAWVPGIYEPETTAFGGPAGMDVAHELFHRDSLHVLDQLARWQQSPDPPGLGRRELAVMLFSVSMRAAGLDWYEQGDVWARVAAERPRPPRPVPQRHRAAVRRLMTVDAGRLSNSGDGRLAPLADWISTFEWAGQQLARLNRHGRLERGLRAVLAHHLIFHWNRLGLPREDQSALSTLAKEAVMGTSEDAASTPGKSNATATVAGVNSDSTETSPDDLRARFVDKLVSNGSIRTPHVEEAMRSVPRHLFVPQAPLEKAYSNSTVDTKLDSAGRPISCASQPSIVAMMLEQLQVEPGMKVLELGAGTGFNAGLLGHLVGEKGHVITIDVDEDIVEGARSGLEAAGLDNVTVLLGDGAQGDPANAPYDRIEATVGAHAVPHAWLDQLAPQGRLLSPLRLRGSVSRSIAFERDAQGRWRSVGSEMNTFMPLRRGIADDPRAYIPLSEDGSVTLVANGDQDPDANALADVLAQPRAEAWTGVTLRGPESPEWLELWLTCTLPEGLSHMPAKREAIDSGLLTNPYPSATATFDKGTLTYLTRRKADHTAADGASLYEFGVIGHGPEAEQLTKRVADAARTWDADFRNREVAFEIQPLDAPAPEHEPGRFAFDNPLNRIIIEWQ
ncbi:methyltransferase, FxLD system [Streptomyces daliensis]|uniref:Protein-L-isoaspartate O-methyltransferase n=1 Tax=Streptomyces daliensis TaxID=299421 RepID=A0A8T4J317_9ACTN|nr:methyltransferase, FxLD system [Streptomyces daliensis]